MNFTIGSTYRFKWTDYELLAVCEGGYYGQPMFREPKSGLLFDLGQVGSPEITHYDEAEEALKNYKPDLSKFAPTFMGFRTKNG